MKFEYHEHHLKLNKNQVIADLKRVSKMLGCDSLSMKEYDDQGEYSSSAVRRRFGSWNSALREAGLNCRNEFHTAEEMFQNLENVWIRKGRQPRRSEMNDKSISVISSGAYLRKFSRWSNALRSFVEYINAVDDAQTLIDSTLNAKQHKTARDINLRLRFKVLQRDKFKCCSCGASPAKDPGVVLHVDHIFPWSKGGETVLENLQTLCSKCNGGKSNLT